MICIDQVWLAFGAADLCGGIGALPPEPVLERLAELAPREMRRAWMTAFGNARLDGRGNLLLKDLPAEDGRKSQIGFVH